MPSPLFDSLVQPAKALSHPARFRLAALIAQAERSVDELARESGLAVTTTSAHLQSLRHAGLVTRRREGQRCYYALSGDDVAALLVAIAGVAHAHLGAVEPARRAALGLPGTEHSDVREMGRDELLAQASAGHVLVLDVRPRHEYDSGHIPGAVSIPLADLAARLDELPDALSVVAYCRGRYCVMAYEAVRVLAATGRQARVLTEGMQEWRVAGYPVEVT